MTSVELCKIECTFLKFSYETVVSEEKLKVGLGRGKGGRRFWLYLTLQPPPPPTRFRSLSNKYVTLLLLWMFVTMFITYPEYTIIY